MCVRVDIFNAIAAIGTLLSAIFAAVSAYQAKKSAEQTHNIAIRNEHNELDKKLEDILKIAIKYPYLEYRGFTSKWNEQKDRNDIRYIRYDNFCNLLFNYLHKVYEVFDGDKAKIENYIDIRNWIYLHEDNWKNPIIPHENIEGYDEKFRDFINSYIK
ncbi:hypothetical protein EZS27_031882 [termite gut metagenome]|uniref:Uncharacterized protein n=1 Tax=termite gut metagenome TaxID=433724 RepID=A0A5J4QAH3_9ZZZZ